jgi:hypothetical protein
MMMRTKKHATLNPQPPTSNEVPLREFHSAFGVECWMLNVFVWLFVLVSPLYAQDHTIAFSTADAGVTRAITNWGLDTCWQSFDNMQRGLIFMGTNNVKIVRVGFTVDSPLTNNDVSPADKTNLLICANYANMATGAAKWDMNELTGVNSWYQNGSGTVYPDRWAAAIEACQRYYQKNFWSVEGFNEPDYSQWGEGSRQNLYDIFGSLQASTNFPGAAMAGGSTLNDDSAVSWFNAVSPRATIGTTHCLAGSVSSYVNFLQTVAASNALPFNPEVHNVCETIIGANYGLKAAVWWGTAELARGNFVKACQGMRLGYADDWANWTAAAVYRGTNGAVQAFVGASERMATTTSYRFFSKDRDVFYDGYGPQRDYTVTIPGGTGYQVNQPNAEKLVNITWGADVQPPIGGRYIVVNRNSGKVLGVPGSSTNWGATLTQNTYTNGNNQLWDVYRLAATNGGDFSYYTLTAVHSGATADESNFSYNDGNAIIQYGTGGNAVEHWFFEYTGNGYFYIRSRWSGKYLDVSGASVNNGASIVQWTGLNRNSQQWRLIPAGAAVEFVAPAAPTGVAASANAVSVQLNWKTNSESDLASYTVLRSTNSGGPYEICARGLTNNAFTDKFANRNTRYYYYVQAVDRSLNTSVNSAQVSALPGCGPAIVAHYTFDGNFSDSSGNANNPIVFDGSPALVAGKYGSALGLAGTNQDVMLPAGMMAGVTNFTIAAWVCWNGGSAWQRIFDFGNDTTSYMFLTPGSGNNTLRFAITTNGSGAEQIIETAPLASNRWIHVAVTCGGATGRLYTNGVLAASGGVSLNPSSFNPALNYLGKSQFAGDPFFKGALDEVLVANYAMSAAQVAWLPLNSAPLPALVHRYSFNETSGTNVSDSIGGAAWNGALPNGGTFGGGQLALSSANSQFVNLPAGILSNYTAVTIEAWATFPNQIPWNTMFFSFGKTNGPDGNSYISCSPQGGRIAITSTNSTGEQNAYSGMDFSFHTNLHVTAIYNPSASYMAIYTNGVMAGASTAVTTPMNAVSNVFSYIGRSLYSGDAYFNVSLDEFRVYNGVMQPADIATAQLAGPDVLLTTNVALNTSNRGGNLNLTWPVAGSGFTLASSPALGGGAVWTPVPVAPNIVGANYQLAIAPTNGTLFFRLQR